jgi:hypothetical protein
MGSLTSKKNNSFIEIVDNKDDGGYYVVQYRYNTHNNIKTKFMKIEKIHKLSKRLGVPVKNLCTNEKFT